MLGERLTDTLQVDTPKRDNKHPRHFFIRKYSPTPDNPPPPLGNFLTGQTGQMSPYAPIPSLARFSNTIELQINSFAHLWLVSTVTKFYISI